VVEPKIFTGVKYSYELDDQIELPLKVCDLAPLSSLAISIYNIDRIEQEPIASTVIDLFDAKRRLRQGTWNLMMHKHKYADTSHKCTTPALTENASCIGINKCLR